MREPCCVAIMPIRFIFRNKNATILKRFPSLRHPLQPHFPYPITDNAQTVTYCVSLVKITLVGTVLSECCRSMHMVKRSTPKLMCFVEREEKRFGHQAKTWGSVGCYTPGRE
jgi:hypothetical protein